MRKNLLIFLGCILILLCVYRWGDVKWEKAKTVAVQNLYMGISNFMLPTLGMYDASAGELAYEDIRGMFLPVLSTMGQNSVGTHGSKEPVESIPVEKNPSEIENSEIENSEIVEPSQGTEEPSEDTIVPSIGTEEPAIPTVGAEILAGLKKQVVINRQKLQDFDYLRQNFYQIDNSTTIGKELLNVEALLGKDVALKENVEGPQILIYHTHSQEAYKDSKPGDASTSIMAVGEYLAQLLSEQYGIEVLHHKGQFDIQDHAKAYSTAKPVIQKVLQEYPSIEVVIDLHRDGVAETTHLVTEINGKPTAKLMFFNGLSRTTSTGQLAYLENPYIEDNLALSFQMQLAAAEYFPTLTRKIYLKGYRYNMHLCPKSMLIEVGAQTNSFEEAKNAMEPLAILLAKVLKTDKVP